MQGWWYCEQNWIRWSLNCQSPTSLQTGQARRLGEKSPRWNQRQIRTPSRTDQTGCPWLQNIHDQMKITLKLKRKFWNNASSITKSHSSRFESGVAPLVGSLKNRSSCTAPVWPVGGANKSLRRSLLLEAAFSPPWLEAPEETADEAGGSASEFNPRRSAVSLRAEFSGAGGGVWWEGGN